MYAYKYIISYHIYIYIYIYPEMDRRRKKERWRVRRGRRASFYFFSNLFLLPFLSVHHPIKNIIYECVYVHIFLWNRIFVRLRAPFASRDRWAPRADPSSDDGRPPRPHAPRHPPFHANISNITNNTIVHIIWTLSNS